MMEMLNVDLLDAVGVMQLMPATGAQMNVGDIKITETNIHAGTKLRQRAYNNNALHSRAADCACPLTAGFTPWSTARHSAAVSVPPGTAVETSLLEPS